MKSLENLTKQELIEIIRHYDDIMAELNKQAFDRLLTQHRCMNCGSTTTVEEPFDMARGT